MNLLDLLVRREKLQSSRKMDKETIFSNISEGNILVNSIAKIDLVSKLEQNIL